MQQKQTILVIDDDRTELGIMTTVLSAAGYRVLIAEDGTTGINRALFAKPDMILLDVMMPGIDGYETCKQLRKHTRTKDIPIFFKTCKNDNWSMISGFRDGIDDYFVKPCNHNHLLRQIKSRLISNRFRYLETRLPSLF